MKKTLTVTQLMSMDDKVHVHATDNENRTVVEFLTKESMCIGQELDIIVQEQEQDSIIVKSMRMSQQELTYFDSACRKMRDLGFDLNKPIAMKNMEKLLNVEGFVEMVHVTLEGTKRL